jgi:hypothetical protein
MVIGNTVREILGTKESVDVQSGIYALKQWKYVAKEAQWGTSVFGRLFFTGGHSIITRTPSEVPFVGFSPFLYAKETVIMLLPERISGPLHQQYYLYGKYAGNSSLLAYGFQLRKEFQVGATLLGHFWSLGGYPFIFLGTLSVALMQGIIILIVNRAYAKQVEKGLFYLAFIIQPIFWMSGRTFIIAFRDAFIQLILGVAFYHTFVYLFVKRFPFGLSELAYEDDYQKVQLSDGESAN